MTSSRAERPVLAAVLAAALLSCPSAWAQSSPGPVQLGPPPSASEPVTEEPGTTTSQPSTSGPRRLVPGRQPADDDGRSAQQRPVSPTQRSKSGIEIEGVSAVDSESVGALTVQEGGFGPEMWRGLTRTQAVDLVQGMPAALRSQVLREVASRILLSRAKAPVAVSEDASSILAARADALVAMGDVTGAELLLSVSPKQGRPRGLDRLDALLNVIKYDNARACGLARNNQAVASEDFWARLLVYCDALDGRSDEAQFGLSLLRETSGDDAAMAVLTDAILGAENMVVETVATPKPIHIAMSRAAKVGLPTSIAESGDPVVLYAVATAPHLQLGTRIEAAERAVMMGALDAVELRRLYNQVPYQPDDLSNALSRAAEIGGAAARALLYQAASKQNVPSARAEIISSAFDVAREEGRYMAAARAFRPLLDRVPPTPEMVWFAVTGVRAFLNLGDAVGTDRWLALLRASASVRDESRLALDRVRPVARVLGAGDKSTPLAEVLTNWERSLEERPELKAARSLVYGMYLALGEKLPDGVWDGVESGAPAGGAMPPPAVWFRFRDSLSAALRRTDGMDGRTVTGTLGLSRVSAVGAGSAANGAPIEGVAKPLILALQAMGGDADPNAAVAYEVVAALRGLGLEREARRLAVETVLAAGL